MNGKRPDLIIIDDPIQESVKSIPQLISDNAQMKSMVEDLRNQIFQLVQKNEILEKEIASSVRLIWAAANSQPDKVLRIQKDDLESIDSSCQLESGYDPDTQETWFRANRFQ